MKIKKILTGLLIGAVALAAVGCTNAATTQQTTNATTAGATQATKEETKTDAPVAKDPVTVKIGLTGTFNEDIWAPVAEVLAKENIKLEYVQFSNFSLPNAALNSGDIDINAFQHHAFLNNEIKNYGYDITDIGDTYIVAMGIFSNKIKSFDELKDGDKVAIPNDATNEGRALKLLESAGIIEFAPESGATPTIADIKKYNKKVEFVEVDANLVYSTLPDVTIAVINGNYAVDSGLKASEALLIESEYTNNNYFGLIAVRTADANNEVYKRIVEVYQSELTKNVFEKEFAGFFLAAWEKKVN